MATKASITPLSKVQRFFIIILGLAFIGTGIYIYADMFNFGKGVSTSKGKIIGIQKVEDMRYNSSGKRYKSVTHRPVVEFTVGAKKIKFVEKVASDFYKVDQEVRVNYDPKNPSTSSRLAGKKELAFPAIAVLFGAIALLLGFFAPSKK